VGELVRGGPPRLLRPPTRRRRLAAAANRPLSSCKQGAKRRNPAAFYWHPCQASASGQVRVYVTTIKCRTNRLPVLRFGRDHGSLHARKPGPCALRCLSPTFPRTRVRFFVSPPASASRRTSSSPRALRPATVRSAAPAWITSIRSRSSVTSTGRRSRLGGPAPARGSFSSPRVRAALISRTRSGAATSCCSAGKRRACPRRCTQPPTRGSSFRCEKACARSTWRWPPPWRWAKRCGKPQRPPSQSIRHRGKDLSEPYPKNTKRGRDISRPWALPPPRIAPWRHVPPYRLSKSPHKRRRTSHPQHPPRRQGSPKQWQKKASPGIFPGPNNGKKKLG